MCGGNKLSLGRPSHTHTHARLLNQSGRKKHRKTEKKATKEAALSPAPVPIRSGSDPLGVKGLTFRRAAVCCRAQLALSSGRNTPRSVPQRPLTQRLTPLSLPLTPTADVEETSEACGAGLWTMGGNGSNPEEKWRAGRQMRKCSN